MPAPGLMSLKEWKGKTSLRLRIRGPRLCAVDAALERYHDSQGTANLLGLINAIEIYRSTREGGWQNYRRNEGHIFEVLMSQIFNLSSHDAEIQAMAALPFFGIESWAVEGAGTQDLADAIREERRRRLHQLFHGQALRFRWGSLAWREAKVVGLASAKVQFEVTQGGGDGSSVMSAITDRGGAAGQEFLSHVPIPKPDLAELVPVFGLIYDGLKTAWEWKQYLDMMQDKGKFPGFQQACSGEATDVQAAIRAVRSYLEQRMNAQQKVAGIQTAAFATKIGTLFADGGVGSHAAITSVKAALKIYVTLQVAYNEFQEMKAAQLMMNNPDAGIFQACPLLGCYMVTACDHSDLLNMFDGRRDLSKYWQYEAVYHIQEINKLRDMARSYMAKSNIELVGAASTHNTLANKLHWMALKTKATLGATSHSQGISGGSDAA